MHTPRKSLLQSLLLGGTILLGSTIVNASPLTLKNITLSTSGLAQFDWSASVSAGNTALTLPIRRNQVDDVLKSLVVLDNSGSINSVSLAGQESLKQLFTDLPFNQDDLNHPAVLLDALKGQSITVEGQENATGQLVSVHKKPTLSDENKTLTHEYIITLMGKNGLREVTLNNLNTVKFLDPSLNNDIQRALSTVKEQSKQDTRNVTINLSGSNARDVQVSYVVEAPLWKAAYRIVLPSKDDKNAFVQGWAVLENTTGGDWNNIDLSLVSGNPVTYRQALYDVYHVDRPTLPVEVFGKVMPRKDSGEFETGNSLDEMMPSYQSDKSVGRMAKKAMAPRMMADAVMAESAPAPSIAGGSNMALSSETAGQMVFKFPQDISLPSGHSMMIPFINTDLTAEKIYLFQSDVNNQHPLSSLNITNNSKTGLPPGIVTLYSPEDFANNTYIGDAQMPLVNTGDSRMLSFAVDGKTSIKTDSLSKNRTTSISIVGGTMKVTQASESTTFYTIKAPKDEDRTVVIEHRKRGSDWKLIAPKGNYTETDTHYRVKTSVKAGEQTKIPVTLERINYQSLQVANVHSNNLNHYVKSWKEISPDAKKVFARLFQLRGLVDDFDAKINSLQQSQDRIIKDQDRIRENLKAVAQNSDLAKRYMKQLNEQEDYMEDNMERIEDLHTKRDDAMKRLQDYIRNVKV